MITRTFDADLINSYIAKDPAFFKVKTPESYPMFYFLHAAGVGMFVGAIKGSEMWMHACCKKRGRAAVAAAKEVIDWVFRNTAATKIKTRADKTKRHLLIYNALILNRCGEDEKYAYYEVSKWATS